MTILPDLRAACIHSVCTSACLQVAALTGVAFNNLLCSMLPLAPPTSATEAVAVASNLSLITPSPLLVEYAPIVFINHQTSPAAIESELSGGTSASTTLLAR